MCMLRNPTLALVTVAVSLGFEAPQGRRGRDCLAGARRDRFAACDRLGGPEWMDYASLPLRPAAGRTPSGPASAGSAPAAMWSSPS